MKKVAVVVLALFAALATVVPAQAHEWHRDHHGRGGIHVWIGPPCCFVPPPVIYEPAPPVVAPPAPQVVQVQDGSYWNGYEWVPRYVTVPLYYDYQSGRYYYVLHGRVFWY